jgi:magnesium transporter
MGKPRNGKAGSLEVISSKGMTWIDVPSPTKEKLSELKKRYPFLLDIDLKDCLPPFQRPKLLERKEYLFMVLLFPVYDEKSGLIRTAEADFFIGKDFIVSSHVGPLHALDEMHADCTKDRAACIARNDGHPGKWLYEALHLLIVECFPTLTRISHDIDEVESAVFGKFEESTVKDILHIKSNIVDYRKLMQGHETVIKKFLERSGKFFDTVELLPLYEDILGHMKEIWDYLDNDRDTIDAVYDSHLSLVTFETNQATRKLTGLAFVVFPMTLVAAIFAMRAETMPFVGKPHDFLIMLSFVFGTMLCTVLFLRHKKWLE